MGIVSTFFVLLVVLIHFFIFIVEVFQWNKPLGIKMFKLEENFANSTKVMAINQGWYNLFLAGGLVYSIIIKNFGVGIFFLSCVSIAGIVGGITSNKKIVFVQTFPATLAIALLILGL